MCKFSVGLIVVVALSVLITPFVFAEPNMKEGQWEISGEMKLEGMPVSMPAMPIKYTQCLTKKDIVPQKKEKDQDCKMISNKISGNTVTWVMQCKDKNGMTESRGTVTYKGNSFDSTIRNVTTDSSGEKAVSTIRMTGKRTGDCK
jgi:hypothetical protein